MRAPSHDISRRLTLAFATLCVLASPSTAQDEPAGPSGTRVGPVVKAVAEGDVARGAALTRRIVGAGPARTREAAQLRMLLAEHKAGLLPGLDDADPEVRAACVWALGWIRDWESAAEVEKLLADPDAQARLEAARALGEFGEKRFAESLARAAADADAGVRRAALDSLRKLGTGFEAAVRAIEDESREVRYAAAKLLGDVRADDPEIKRLAARALAARSGLRRRRDDAAPSLTAWDEDGWELRHATVVALGRLRMDEGIPALVRATSDRDERVAVAAMIALGDARGGRAARALVSIAEGGGPRAGVAVESLGRAGVRSGEIIEALLRIVREGPLEVARTAAEALATLGGESAREALVRASLSERKEVHGAVAEAAARLGEYRPAGALLRDLDDEDEWVALGAARSLAEIGNPAGFPVFIRALRSEDERVRAFAATCLALYSGARMDLWTDGPASERERIAREWRSWWLRNRDTFAVRRAGPGLAR